MVDLQFKYKIIRDVSVQECPWLATVVGGPLKEGTTVYRFTKPTYGAVDEFAVTLNEDRDYPFFEVPYDSVEPVRE
jgi:hypothetical protein